MVILASKQGRRYRGEEPWRSGSGKRCTLEMMCCFQETPNSEHNIELPTFPLPSLRKAAEVERADFFQPIVGLCAGLLRTLNSTMFIGCPRPKWPGWSRIYFVPRLKVNVLIFMSFPSRRSGLADLECEIARHAAR
jgi:hypothetical protein